MARQAGRVDGIDPMILVLSGGHAGPAGNWEAGDRTLHHPYQERKATDRSA